MGAALQGRLSRSAGIEHLLYAEQVGGSEGPSPQQCVCVCALCAYLHVEGWASQGVGVGSRKPLKRRRFLPAVEALHGPGL